MSKLATKEKPRLKRVEVIVDGSAKTFVYENLNEKPKQGPISKLKAKIRQKLEFLLDE